MILEQEKHHIVIFENDLNSLILQKRIEKVTDTQLIFSDGWGTSLRPQVVLENRLGCAGMAQPPCW